MDHLNEIVEVDDWTVNPDNEGVHGFGTRDKLVLISPPQSQHAILKPNHIYLWKRSHPRYDCEFWMEILAYRLGCLIGVDVPPAYVGARIDEETGERLYAALIEWFHQRWGEGILHGGELMCIGVPGYDRKKGEQHNLRTILRFFPESIHWREHWARVLTFDTLIGNRDRHQDNWGFVISGSLELSDEGRLESQFKRERNAPAFDNGSSLGREITEDKMESVLSVDSTYLTNKKRARHHMQWEFEEGRQSDELNFYQFMRRFADTYPETRDTIAKRLDFTIESVREAFDGLVGLIPDPKWRLSKKRLDFTIELIMRRQALLREALEL